MTTALPLTGRAASDVDAMRSEDIRTLRRAVYDLGYYDDAARLDDDQPDREMFRALRMFQRDHDLIPDGVAEPQGPTARMLAAALEAQTAPRSLHPGALPGTIADRPEEKTQRTGEVENAIDMGATAARLLAKARPGNAAARRELEPYRALLERYRDKDPTLAALFDNELRQVPGEKKAAFGLNDPADPLGDSPLAAERTNTVVDGQENGNQPPTLTKSAPRKEQQRPDPLVKKSSAKAEPSEPDADRTGIDVFSPDIQEYHRKLMAIADEWEKGDYPLAGRFLKHFLDLREGSSRPDDGNEVPSGSKRRRNVDIQLTRDELYVYEPVLKAEKTNRDRFERWTFGNAGFDDPSRRTLVKSRYDNNSGNEAFRALVAGDDPFGKKIKFSDEWVCADDVSGPELFLRNGDFYRAFGDWQLTSKGDFEAVRQGDTITVTGDVTHLVDEPYNFESRPEQNPIAGIGGGFLARDLQEAGAARVFCVKAVWCQKVHMTLKVRPGGRVDPDNIEWSNASCTENQKERLRKQCDA